MSRPTTRTVDEGSATLLGGIPVGRRGGRGGRGRGVTGPNLPERLELVGAALPDADRGRFEQQLDQALDTPRSSGTCGHAATSSRPGIDSCSPVGTAVRAGTNRGPAAPAAKRRSGRPNRLTWRTRSAAS